MKVSDENDNQLCYNLVLFFPFYGLEKGYLQEYIYACTVAHNTFLWGLSIPLSLSTVEVRGIVKLQAALLKGEYTCTKAQMSLSKFSIFL